MTALRLLGLLLQDVLRDLFRHRGQYLLAVLTLVIKSVVEWQFERDQKAAAHSPSEKPPLAGPFTLTPVHSGLGAS